MRRIKTAFDLRKPGIKLVVGTPTVPIGSYTRTVLRNLALTSVLANAVSLETDVRAILEADLGNRQAAEAALADNRRLIEMAVNRGSRGGWRGA